MKKQYLTAAAVALLLGAAVLVNRTAPRAADPEPVQTSALAGLSAVLYKSPSCGCCDGYAEFLTTHGVQVSVVSNDAAMLAAKRDHGIPAHASSCHTVSLGGYVIEGHVPLAALEQLFAELPRVDGLVLPGMPVGTPGMPGRQTGPISVLSLQGGELQPFLEL